MSGNLLSIQLQSLTLSFFVLTLNFCSEKILVAFTIFALGTLFYVSYVCITKEYEDRKKRRLSFFVWMIISELSKQNFSNWGLIAFLVVLIHYSFLIDLKMRILSEVLGHFITITLWIYLCGYIMTQAANTLFIGNMKK